MPWAKRPGTKTAQCYLQDILADIPRYFEDLNIFLAEAGKGRDQTTLRESLSDRLLGSLRQLLHWRWEWERNHPDVAWEVPVDPRTSLSLDSDGRPMFKTVLYYRSFSVSHDIILYNCTLQMLLHLGHFFHGPDVMPVLFSTLPDRPDDVQSKNPLILPHRDLTIVENAREMLRSIDYHLLEQHNVAGSFALVVPMRCW